MELARCEYIQRRENVIAVGNSGTGKTHVALGLGLAACQRGMSVGFTTAASLVYELMEARDERRLLNLQRQLSRLNLLIIDELGFVPLSRTGAELLFEVFSQRYERGSIMVTTNLPFDEWTEVFGSERLTGALLDRLTHHVHILVFSVNYFCRFRRLFLPGSPPCFWTALLGHSGAVAGDVEFQDDRVVDHPVDGRRCGHRVGEDVLPLGEDHVGRDAQGPAFVAFGDEREEHLGLFGPLGQVPQVVQQQEVVVVELS